MAHEKKKEFGKFASVGIVSTAADYALLNLFAVLLGLPLLVANSISAPFSSFLSYKLNKHVVFEDRMHGRRKTLLLYVAIVATSILIIQNTLLYVLNHTIADDAARMIRPLLTDVGLAMPSVQTIGLNLAKIGASAIAALWNFYLLRRFVFVTKEDTDD
jgi:putative flippase GtrA